MSCITCNKRGMHLNYSGAIDQAYFTCACKYIYMYSCTSSICVNIIITRSLIISVRSILYFTTPTNFPVYRPLMDILELTHLFMLWSIIHENQPETNTYEDQPGEVGVQTYPRSTPPHARHNFSWRFGHENVHIFLWAIFLFHWLKKISSQLMSKECTVRTGKLHSRLLPMINVVRINELLVMTSTVYREYKETHT